MPGQPNQYEHEPNMNEPIGEPIVDPSKENEPNSENSEPIGEPIVDPSKKNEPNSENSEPHIDPSKKKTKPSDNIQPIICQPPHRTLPQKISDISAVESKPDRMTQRKNFMGLFNREGSSLTHKKKPSKNSNQGRSKFNCQDIRKFYSF